MNKLQSIQKDINKLEKALTLIQNTENHAIFQKSILMGSIIKNINILKDKHDRQEAFLKSL
jgi:hypothetical protein